MQKPLFRVTYAFTKVCRIKNEAMSMTSLRGVLTPRVFNAAGCVARYLPLRRQVALSFEKGDRIGLVGQREFLGQGKGIGDRHVPDRTGA